MKIEHLTDSVIVEGLKSAVVEAFFKQQTRFNPSGNYTETYGGSATQLVKDVLESPDFQAVIKSIVGDISEREAELGSLIGDAVKVKAQAELEKLLVGPSSSNYSSLNATILRAAQDRVNASVQAAVAEDARLQQLIADKVGAGDWDIKIHVTATVTEKA